MSSWEAPETLQNQSLTTRELEVLTCLAQNMSNRQIAEHLIIAESTVKWYVRQLFNKLDVNKRRDAVTRAKTLGLLQTDGQVTPFRHNLPYAMTPFWGREAELSALDQLVVAPDVRIITVVAQGGMGKTRLAMEVARRQIEQRTSFPDGVFFVALAPLEAPEDIAGAIVAALDIPLHEAAHKFDNETQQLIDYLSDKRMLLVLDNFEHLLDGRTLLTQIVTRAGNVKLLVTSRQRLLLSGEQLFFLHGLEMPDTTEISVTKYAAAQLFVSASKRLLPDFKLHDGDAEQLLRICRLVDGMPLGIELAAAWAGMMSLANIAEEIERNLHILNAEYHDMPERHRSMQATLEISWNRLNAEQQVGFQNLTVFRDGMTRAAASEVAGVTLPLLVTLVHKSWLSYDRERDRYTVHELQRQFGAVKLQAEIGREKMVRQQHSIYFCNYLNKREKNWFGENQKEAAFDIRREIENIRQAWRWAAAEGDSDLLAQGLNSLCYFYQRESRNTDGQNACQIARAVLEKNEKDGREPSPQELVLLSRILSWQSGFTDNVKRKEMLLAQSQATLDRVSASTTDTRPEQAVIYREQAQTAYLNDYEEGVRLAQHTLKLYRNLGDRWGESETLKLIGSSYNYLGQYVQSAEFLRQALKLKRQLNDTNGSAKVLHNLANVVRHQGAFEEAEALHRESLELFGKLDNRRQQRRCLASYSYTLLFSGKFSEAMEIAKQGIELDRQLGLYPDPWMLNPFSLIATHLGHYDEAKRTANECLQLSRSRGELMNHSWALWYLGSIALVEGDLIGARRFLLQSVAVLAELKHVYHSILKAVLSYITRVQGDMRLSRHYLAAALHAAIEAGSVSPVMYCLPAAALHAVDMGDVERAIELYSMAQRFGLVANSRWFSDVACDELSGLMASLPTETINAPRARGRELELWSTAEQLLLEMGDTQGALQA
ncbi:MAG: tetratricopeptide repeat protein [Anaerolineae bacterium]|nr:tetratricopeptide repeat protein [Anaerolineae bacterium]MCO5206520.1 tetratricopeptide repeat protein [Anaerolineae bacterium]